MSVDIFLEVFPMSRMIRNHVAKELWTPKFRKQIVKDQKKYSRKIKHKNIDLR